MMLIVRILVTLFTIGIILYFALNMTTIISENSSKDFALRLGIIIVSAIALIIFLFDLIKYGKDFKDAKNQRFEQITGTVIRFAKNQDTESGRQVNDFPIIQIYGSEKTIKLSVNEPLKVGETYTFIYLKNTKMGAVKTVK